MKLSSSGDAYFTIERKEEINSEKIPQSDLNLGKCIEIVEIKSDSSSNKNMIRQLEDNQEDEMFKYTSHNIKHIGPLNEMKDLNKNSNVNIEDNIEEDECK